ncbi:MAG: integrase core domain-containing protein [Chloroflexota bacterium]|nr:integrase core domain-containing protein [Chloroflexota bacterium]
MKVFGLAIPNRVSSVHPIELSKKARLRLAWMAWYNEHGRSGRLTCRHYGIGPATFYLWKGRFDEHGPGALEDGSRRPRRLRTPTWTPQLERAVLDLRRMAPRWGKDKLAVLLRQEGWAVSTSMVGRILTKLRSEGRFSAAPLNDPWRRPVRFRRPYGVRKPKDYLAAAPGHIVQVDTVHVQLFAGFRFKHFTACDVFSRWQVLEAHGRATAHAAAGFLDTILERMPFPVRAIQVDGGSEFRAEFENACRQRGVRLFVLPPRSPKLNGHVERSNRTHREEFYQVVKLLTTLAEVNRALRKWEDIHNSYRPHQALRYLTPKSFLNQLERSCA